MRYARQMDHLRCDEVKGYHGRGVCLLLLFLSCLICRALATTSCYQSTRSIQKEDDLTRFLSHGSHSVGPTSPHPSTLHIPRNRVTTTVLINTQRYYLLNENPSTRRLPSREISKSRRHFRFFRRSVVCIERGCSLDCTCRGACPCTCT